MAKVLTPLLSFNAVGALGKTIVFSSWKGIKTARSYAVPANPRSDAQVAQRNMLATVVEFWRNPGLTQLIRESWNRAATVASVAQSGFNQFTSAVVRIGNQLADASIAISAESTTSDTIDLILKNLDDFDDGDEAGDFVLRYGSSPTNLNKSSEAAIVVGGLSFTVEDAPGATRYAQVVKTAGDFVGAPRSGIFRVTMG